jgi:glycosyltransferase involved in cell wall biosynthesis
MDGRFFISVVIPLYNKESIIKKTVESVLMQSYENFELIIVDDGSTDKSLVNVLSIQDPRIRIEKKINGGVSSARNLGLKLARGDYILLLDADDTLYPYSIEKLVNNALKYNKPDIICGGFSITNDKNKVNVVFTESFYEQDLIELLFKEFFYLRMGNFIFTREVLHKQEAKFDERFNFYEDMSFILSILTNSKIVILADLIMNYAQENGELSIRPPKLYKDWTFYAVFNNKGYYEKMILATIIGRSIRLRLINKEYINVIRTVRQ